MLHVQRGSLGAGASGVGLMFRVYDASHALYEPTASSPLFVTIDLYKNTHAEAQQFSALSLAEGLATAQIFAGGYGDSGTFGSLAAARGLADLIEGVVVLGTQAGDPGAGAFYLGAKDLPEGAWYTLGLLLTPDSMSVWVRDTETVLDAATPVRTSGAFAGQAMFAEFGLGLESGWAQVYPGTEDNPGTAGVVEGYGLARDENGQTAPVMTDASGNRVAPAIAATSVDTWRLSAGNDPVGVLPGYEIRDWWADNYCVRGGRRAVACPADLSGDGSVGADDLAVLLAAWGGAGAGDVDGDGIVGAGDLAAVLAGWGACL